MRGPHSHATFTDMSRRPSRISSSPLPPLYAAWADDLLHGPIPQETEATCSDCAMCSGPKDRGREADFFRPDTKCCTYVPELPNFLVGRILSEEDPRMAAGKATVEARIAAGIHVTPLGLGRSRVQSLLYVQGQGAAFGRNRTLRCPHYLEKQGGLCGIWLHRNAICATWFCKHVRGAVGDRFWKTLLQLLGAVEGALTRWCVLKLGLNSDALARLFPPNDPNRPAPLEPGEIDGVVDAASYRALWGNWWKREREFYEKCARLVSGLSWAKVVSIAGPDVRLHAHLTREAYKALMATEVPDRLVAAPLRVTPMGEQTGRIVTYRPYDPLAVSQTVLDLLPFFDGRPTKEVLRRIQKERGVRLGKGLVRKLADFEILVSAASEPESPEPRDGTP